MRALVFILLAAVLVSGCIGDKTTELMESYDRAGAKTVAETFVIKHANGIGVNCVVGLFSNNTYDIGCSYRVQNVDGDYDRHVMDVKVANGDVIDAIMDKKVHVT